jgi:hypothetical protein
MCRSGFQGSTPKQSRFGAARAGAGVRVATLVVSAIMAGAAAAVGPAGDPSWQVRRGIDPLTGARACLLESGPHRMADGYGNAEVRVIFGSKGLIVITDSNIDPSYPDQGIRVDEHPRIAPDEPFPAGPMNAGFGASTDDLVERFRRGNLADLALGFWPTWPVTQTQHLALSLRGFTKAHDEFLACRGEQAAAARN